MSDVGSQILSFALPLLPGFAAGFFLGRLARKALMTALLIAGGIVVVLFLIGHFGGDISGVTSWLKSTSAWAGEQLEGAKQYLAAILPTAAALAVGFKVGLGRG
jgi:uncharacterized membrane protein (Fun14 family)